MQETQGLLKFCCPPLGFLVIMYPGPRQEYLHTHSYSSCSWDRLQVSFVFDKDYSWQHLESLLPPMDWTEQSQQDE